MPNKWDAGLKALSTAIEVIKILNGSPWDKPTSLADSFLASRAIAYSQGCEKEPCFAMGQRKASESAKPLDGVAEYVLYVTDGAIVVAAFLFLGAVVFLIAVLFPTRNAGL